MNCCSAKKGQCSFKNCQRQYSIIGNYRGMNIIQNFKGSEWNFCEVHFGHGQEFHKKELMVENL